jgi:hypothetical protein
MKTTIIKSKLSRNFTTIPNEILKRTDISLSAKGLYCFIHSLPEDWVFYKNKLSEMTGESRRQIDNAFKELERHGYLICADIIRKGLKQKEYIFYQFPYNDEISTNAQNEQSSTDVRFEQTVAQNEHRTDAQNEQLLNTKLLNTKIEKEITTTETADADFFSFDKKLRDTNKNHRNRLMKECNEQLRKSIEKTSNKKFNEDDLVTFNVHLALENKEHEDFNEYCKHFRNYLGKRKMPKK